MTDRRWEQYLAYLRNTGQPILPVEAFDDDWSPAGPMIRAELVKAGLVEIHDGGMAIIIAQPDPVPTPFAPHVGGSREGMPRGYAFGGERAQRVQSHLGVLARQNAGRVQCPYCPLMVLPASLDRHMAVCHEDAA